MPKPVKVGLVSAVLSMLLASLVVATATAALPKPKPWQWKPAKVVLKLTAAKPINGGEVGSNILAAQCTPHGKGVAGRYSRFTCEIRYGGSNASYTMPFSIRVLPVGSGKLCVVSVTRPSFPGEFFSWHPSGKPGARIQPQFACPSPGVVP